MQKIVLVYGLIAGLILTTVMFVTTSFIVNESNFAGGEILGFVSMIIALSMVFFGTKSYRDNHLGGHISFGQAFKVGIMITLVASLMYVIGWEVYSQTVMPDFMDKYTEHLIREQRAEGASEAEIAATTKEMKQWGEMYKNPLVRAGMTFIEIFPVGLLITLICSLILKRRRNAVMAT
jgi:hypothetical protein